MYYVARERGINASPMAASFGPFLAESRKGRYYQRNDKLKFAQLFSVQIYQFAYGLFRIFVR